MNKEKIVEKLNKWVQEEFGSLYHVEDDNDLTLLADGNCVAWFMDFKKHKFRFAQSDDDLNVKLIKEGILEKFYDKAIELLTKSESKYTVQIIENNSSSYINVNKTSKKIIFSDKEYSEFYKNKFTQLEIEVLKNRDDLAVDWCKAIIKEVE